MTSIIYRIVADFGECADFIGDGSTNVRIQVCGIGTGTLVIGSVAARLSSGIAHLDISSLPDGEYTPILFSGSKRTNLEKIKLRNGHISRLTLDPELIERLLNRVRELEDEQCSINARLEVCEMAIHPKTLFN